MAGAGAAPGEKSLKELDLIPVEEETKCADDLWDLIESNEEDLEDLEEYARRRGLKA